MPSKSDSAGKLHQFYTCKELELKCEAKCTSPLDDLDEKKIHLSSFNDNEIISLKKIGKLSAHKIISLNSSTIIEIEDIGVSSGAVGFDNTDDLAVTLENEEKISYSLKCGNGISQILSKNMGAKSLIEEYFKAKSKQEQFNYILEESHLFFLNNILNTSGNNISEIKKKINEDAKAKGLEKARFSDECYKHANEGRSTFLRVLRNELLIILKELDKVQLANAVNLILDTGKNHILADYRFGKEKAEFVNIPVKGASDIIEIKERGNDSVKIETNDYSVGFRYKFESGINSSIKLVGDYKKLTN